MPARPCLPSLAFPMPPKLQGQGQNGYHSESRFHTMDPPDPPDPLDPPQPTPSKTAVASLGEPSRAFYPSHDFMVSAGTVTVDLRTGKVLIVLNKVQGIYQLPKGRKNIGEESLLECALRETLEETGMVVEPLALKVATRCTADGDQAEDAAVSGGSGGSESDSDGDGDGEFADSPTTTTTTGPGLEERLNNECVGLCQYRDAATGAMKFVFYYAAAGDGRATPRPLVGADFGRFENLWCGPEEAVRRLMYREDVSVVRKVVSDLRKTGYRI